MLAPLATGCLFMIASAVSPTVGMVCGALNGCLIGCSGLAWWITGIVWRFRADGAFATGDIKPEDTTAEDWLATLEGDNSLYQYKSGRFIAIYYFITWGLMALSLTCSIIAAIYTCCAAKKSE